MLKLCGLTLEFSTEADLQLSQSVWDMFVQHQQSIKLFRRKMAVWKNLFLAIKVSPKYLDFRSGCCEIL